MNNKIASAFITELMAANVVDLPAKDRSYLYNWVPALNAAIPIFTEELHGWLGQERSRVAALAWLDKLTEASQQRKRLNRILDHPYEFTHAVGLIHNLTQTNKQIIHDR